MPEVSFFDYRERRDVLEGVDTLLSESRVAGLVPRGGSVAVKVHFGELGNVTYVRPTLVRKVVEVVKRVGGRPFVTDTTALYPGGRDTAGKYLATAAYNGFSPATMEAPVVIADVDGSEGVTLDVPRHVDGCTLRQVEVAAELSRADFVLFVSHVKGHEISGFGGALKNIAMGCVTKRTKREQHSVNPSLVDEDRCDGCGACLGVCPSSAIVMQAGKPVKDPDKCMHCDTCLFACPRGAIYWAADNKLTFQVYLAHAAAAVMSIFAGRAGFLNFVQDVTPCCDCAHPAGNAIVPDVGILASLDPVAIDKASLDLIDSVPESLTVVSVGASDKLGKLNGTDSTVQLKTAHRLGLGGLEYSLVHSPRAT